MSSDDVDLEAQFMVDNGILKPDEVLVVKERRMGIAKKIAHGLVTKEELLKNINIELNLLDTYQQKINELSDDKNDDKFEVFRIVSERVNDMYNNLFLLFSIDNANLKEYIEFCVNNDLLCNCSALIGTLMKRRHDEPDLYMTAARYEFEERKNIEEARQYYKMGLCEHSQSKEICLDEFWMEVQHCDKGTNYNMCIEKYKAAIARFQGDIDFHMKLLDTALILRVDEIHSLIVKDMVEIYKHNELLWHFLAQMQLKGYSYNPQTQRLNFSKDHMAVHNCINIYEDILNQSLLQVDKQRLWELYLDTVIEIRQSYRMQNESTKKYMHETLERAFQNAHMSGAMLVSKYYLYWAENSSADDRRAILIGATKALKTNLDLWIELLHLYVTHDCFDNLIEAFQQGVRALKDDSLPLWQIMIRYMHNTHPKLVDQLYNEGSRVRFKVVALELRPAYLDWCALQKGLLSARDLFQDLVQLEPPCLQLYMTMINLEKIQMFHMNKMKNIRKLYNDACNEFGKIDTNIWLECIRFEYDFGSSSLVDEIYKASLLCLEPQHIDTMKTEFEVIKNKFMENHNDENEVIVIDDDDDDDDDVTIIED
ncbi:U3 small nucleolar RNA-associated protein 6 homolog [Adelges cooleyi]|uniref:U3 small nucleolar RNA-associated protein 6 homolog n=1 Tax=Adelges cooleyi TaxID=133065 RepID=UPI0021800CAF|nr:U3 small nucleolar RNA-associated protein 6 homolog [Adelges cooleyi]